MRNTCINRTLIKVFIVIVIVGILSVDGRKTSRGRSSGSSRGSSRRGSSNPQPAPTSFSSPQATAPKPSLFGWQERPAQKTQTWQSKPKDTHSYPSSNTGLSGNNQPKQPSTYQESVQRNNVPLQNAARPGTPSQTNNQASHSYPASNGLSGNSGTGTGAGYPQGSGLSGSKIAPPPYQAANSPNIHQTQAGGSYPSNNMGNNYNQAHGPPPPYSNAGNNYQSHGPPPPYTGVGNSYHQPPPPYSHFGHNQGGYGGYNPGYGQQMPGYFGNSGRGFGGMSRTSSALTGVGIAGAGVGTILTGLALWNLARSTGRPHHTVIYDNRGQPVAVAPDNNSTATAMDSILGDLVNCTLTIASENATEIIAIPCAIATSFTPEADVKTVDANKNENDKTKCTITVMTKAEREFMTTIPCSVLLNTAAENNVTEPPVIDNSDLNVNTTMTSNDKLLLPTQPPGIDNSELNVNTTITSSDNPLQPNQPTALKFSSAENNQDLSSKLNCTLKEGETPDPINPCFPVTHNLTVIPLQSTEATNN